MWRDSHLEQADRHVAEAKQRIARQRELIATLELTNYPIEPAVSMLAAMEKSLQAFEHQSWARSNWPQRPRTRANVRDR
jgi:hypothetical protein